MKTVLVLSVVVVLAVLAVLSVLADTPDFAVPAQRALDGEPCAVIVHFAGPLAVEDRSDCGLPSRIAVRQGGLR